jgi:hypothetical protein
MSAQSPTPGFTTTGHPVANDSANFVGQLAEEERPGSTSERVALIAPSSTTAPAWSTLETE